ncbi:MAG: helicase-related protein, partial [archaeon]
TRESEDVKPYLQELEYDKVVVPFPKEFIEIKFLLKQIYDSKVAELRKRSLLFGNANKISLLKLQGRLGAMVSSSKNFNAMVGMGLTASAIKISHALELLETQTLSGLNEYFKNLLKQASDKKSRAVQNLVKSKEFNAALISLQELIARGIEHPKLEECAVLVENQFRENPKSKVIIFTQFRETGVRLAERLNRIELGVKKSKKEGASDSVADGNNKPEAGGSGVSGAGGDSRDGLIRAQTFFGQAKKGDTGLSQKEQKAIIQKLNDGEINVLVATSIGEEGLDIAEVSTVIFYEPIPSAIRKIQRQGRTARLAPGKLIILMTKDTRDVIYHYASGAREKKMYKTIDTVKRDIKNGGKGLGKWMGGKK